MVCAIHLKVVGVVVLWSEPQFPFINENLAVFSLDVTESLCAWDSTVAKAKRRAPAARALKVMQDLMFMLFSRYTLRDR
jgi:hypothetical protein